MIRCGKRDWLDTVVVVVLASQYDFVRPILGNTLIQMNILLREDIRDKNTFPSRTRLIINDSKWQLKLDLWQ